MTPKNQLKEYIRVMNCVDVDDSVRQQIITNCARYSTMKKIKAGKFKITAIKKDNSVEKI
ncbi:MAG: hypothetical protein IJE74_08840 [Clostridia bacterium]|nr:hypothetical protein [Clostridia bacterium]